MSKCPLCKIDMKLAGRFVAVVDDSNQHFVFAICIKCSQRLRRLPANTAQRQIALSFSNIAKRPECYRVMQFPDAYSARIFAKLETERISAKMLQQIPQYVFAKPEVEYQYQMPCEEFVYSEGPSCSYEILDSADLAALDPA